VHVAAVEFTGGASVFGDDLDRYLGVPGLILVNLEHALSSIVFLNAGSG
jgi:hypothetical protein